MIINKKRFKKILIKGRGFHRLRGLHISSVVNEAIRAILDLFIIFFLQEDFTHTKSTKRMQATFLLLDVFYAHKKHKKHKKQKKHKTYTNDFLPLRCFYVHKNAVFFVFIRLYAFSAFCVCEIFL